MRAEHNTSKSVRTLLLAMLATTGCSVNKFAISKTADSLASQSASSFASDDDPELVGDALPFVEAGGRTSRSSAAASRPPLCDL